MSDQLTIIVEFNGPSWIKPRSYVVPFVEKATVHDALIAAYDIYHAGDTDLSFDVVYYGKGLGNFLQSLYGVPTTKVTSWEIFIDDVPASPERVKWPQSKLTPEGTGDAIPSPPEPAAETSLPKSFGRKYSAEEEPRRDELAIDSRPVATRSRARLGRRDHGARSGIPRTIAAF